MKIKPSRAWALAEALEAGIIRPVWLSYGGRSWYARDMTLKLKGTDKGVK
ncbi:MAG: hypothetical protein WCP55_11535 [Lentisphaerota bacterium]